MTILPKKKSGKEKSGEKKDNSGDLGHPSSGHSLPPHVAPPHSLTLPLGQADVRHDRGARSRTSPPHWVPPSQRDDPDDPQTSSGLSGLVATSSKRRNRSSPHHMLGRKAHRHERSSSSRPLTTCAPSSSRFNLPPRIVPPRSDLVVDGQEPEAERLNSDDELDYAQYSDEEYEKLERWFEKVLHEKRGFSIKKMANDGSCLFRAVADQVYGDQEMHGPVRKMSLDYMAKNRDHFSQYITEDFNHYIARKSVLGCHGNHVEMQAISELFNRPLEVYEYSVEPINTFNRHYQTDNAPIRLSYHRGMHYNSVVDPYAATIGVGLGLPEFQPGQADRNLMAQAKCASENSQLEQAMLKDKLKETDWELTQEAMEEEAAKESYLQWLKDNEKRVTGNTSPRSAGAAATSSTSVEPFPPSLSPDRPDRPVRSPRSRGGSGQNSPKPPAAEVYPDLTEVAQIPHPSSMVTDQLPGSGVYSSKHSTSTSRDQLDLAVPGSSTMVSSFPVMTSQSQGATGAGFGPETTVAPPMAFPETTSLMNEIPSDVLGFADWTDDDAIIAQIMVQSAQEYFDSLRNDKNS